MPVIPPDPNAPNPAKAPTPPTPAPAVTPVVVPVSTVVTFPGKLWLFKSWVPDSLRNFLATPYTSVKK